MSFDKRDAVKDKMSAEERKKRWADYEAKNPLPTARRAVVDEPSFIKTFISGGNNRWYALGGIVALFLMFAMFGG